MKIKYLGHSAFLIEGKEFSVVTDPFRDIGYDVERVSADYCISSHEHFDHNYFDGVNAREIITETKGKFIGTDTFHDPNLGKLRGKNTVFCFELDGIKFCHLGDIGEYYSQDISEELGRVDVLMIPIGGTYTIGWQEALKYISGINPSIAIPMHYRTGKCQLDIDNEKNFIRHVAGVSRVGRQIELSRENLPNETEIYLMED